MRTRAVAAAVSAIALVVSAPCAAQDSTMAEWKTPLKPGVWALEFETQAGLSGYF